MLIETKEENSEAAEISKIAHLALTRKSKILHELSNFRNRHFCISDFSVRTSVNRITPRIYISVEHIDSGDFDLTFNQLPVFT